jgi:hypothetical protein
MDTESKFYKYLITLSNYIEKEIISEMKGKVIYLMDKSPVWFKSISFKDELFVNNNLPDDVKMIIIEKWINKADVPAEDKEASC